MMMIGDACIWWVYPSRPDMDIGVMHLETERMDNHSIMLILPPLTLNLFCFRYLRIKRKNQTMFLHVEPSDSFGVVKKQVAEILEMDSGSILFYAPDRVSLDAGHDHTAVLCLAS